MTDDPSTNSDEWVWRCKYAASGFACSSVLDRHSILCGLTLATPSPVLDSERPASDLIERLTEMVRLIDWRGSEARLRNLLTEAVIALEAADAHRCPTPERDDLAELRAAPGRPDSIQFRLRQFTPHHPVASGRQAMLDAADALDVTRYADGTTPQAPTVDSVPVPRADVIAAASIMQEARFCEGLQEWWGTDSDRMARLDAALDAMRRCGGVQ